MSPDPPLGVTGIARRQFSTARRGYDPAEVRAFLHEVADLVGRLQRGEAHQLERAERAETRAELAEKLDQHRLVELLGEETARVLGAARDAAADIREKAEENVARLVREGQAEAHRLAEEAEAEATVREAEMLAEAAALRHEAEAEVQRRRLEGQGVVDDMRRAAEAEVETLLAEGERARAESETEAERIRDLAREEGRVLVAEAQTVRERMLSDLARRRRSAREQLERLNAARERLLAAYEVVRRTVDEATTELTVALPEARAASEQALRRASDEPPSTVEELEAELAVARMVGLVDDIGPEPASVAFAYAEDPGDIGGLAVGTGYGDPRVGLSASRPERQTPPSDGAADHRRDPRLGTPRPDRLPGDPGAKAREPEHGSVWHRWPFRRRAAAGTRGFDAPTDAEAGEETVEVDTGVGTIGSSSESVGAGVAGNDQVVGWAGDEPTEEGRAGDPAESVARSFAEAEPGAASIAEREPREDPGARPDATEPHEDADDRRDVGDADAVSAGGQQRDDTTAAGADSAPEQPPPSEAGDEVASKAPAAVAVGSADDPGSRGPAGPRNVDELFARLKSEGSGVPLPEGAPSDVPPAETSGDVAASVSGASELAGGPLSVATVVAERDAVTVASGESPAAVEPEPDSQLSRSDALLRERDETLEPIERELGRRLKRVLADEQNEALDLLRRVKPGGFDDVVPPVPEHAGRYADAAVQDLTTAAAWGASAAGGEPGAACDDLAAELGQTLVEPLRERMARSFDESDGDLEEVTERLRALYREWKGQRIGDAVRHYAAAAFAWGAYVAAPDRAELRWLVDHRCDPCPDADDNALAGRVRKGEAFPTGDRCSPAHPGCRCLVIPLDHLQS